MYLLFGSWVKITETHRKNRSRTWAAEKR